MNSLESYQGRSDACYPEERDLLDLGQVDLLRPLVSATEMALVVGLSAPTIRISAIAIPKKLTDKIGIQIGPGSGPAM